MIVMDLLIVISGAFLTGVFCYGVYRFIDN